LGNKCLLRVVDSHIDTGLVTLEAIAEFLTANPETKFYVVGHTDSDGTFSYNTKLSSDRAAAVVTELQTRMKLLRTDWSRTVLGRCHPYFQMVRMPGRIKIAG
jgi:OOP family OmpA-OmpF porin